MHPYKKRIKSSAKNLSKTQAAELVEAVKSAMEHPKRPVLNTETLFFELEPFFREYREYTFKDTRDGRNLNAHTASQILADVSSKGLSKYRASLFSWLSFYYPKLAKKYVKRWKLDFPRYPGQPPLEECSDEAKKAFDQRYLYGRSKYVTSVARHFKRRPILFSTLVFVAVGTLLAATSWLFVSTKQNFDQRLLAHRTNAWGAIYWDNIEIQENNWFGGRRSLRFVWPQERFDFIDHVLIGDLEQVRISGSLTNGQLTSGGVPIEISKRKNQLFGSANNRSVFEFSIKPEGAVEVDLYAPLDHHQNWEGRESRENIFIDIPLTAVDESGAHIEGAFVRITVVDSVPIPQNSVHLLRVEDFLIGGAYLTGGPENGPGGGSGHGSLGFDAPGKFKTNGKFLAVAARSPDEPDTDQITLSSGGQQLNVASLPENAYVGSTPEGVIFEFSMNERTGEYVYQQFDLFDYEIGGAIEATLELSFGYTITDADGDVLEDFVKILVADARRADEN